MPHIDFLSYFLTSLSVIYWGSVIIPVVIIITTQIIISIDIIGKANLAFNDTVNEYSIPTDKSVPIVIPKFYSPVANPRS